MTLPRLLVIAALVLAVVSLLLPGPYLEAAVIALALSLLA